LPLLLPLPLLAYHHPTPSPLTTTTTITTTTIVIDDDTSCWDVETPNGWESMPPGRGARGRRNDPSNETYPWTTACSEENPRRERG